MAPNLVIIILNASVQNALNDSKKLKIHISWQTRLSSVIFCLDNILISCFLSGTEHFDFMRTLFGEISPIFLYDVFFPLKLLARKIT